MLSVRKLRKFYGDFLALDQVSFEVGQGDVLGFLGPNGAGKSTTMKCIVGYLPASRGSIQVDGLEVTRYPLETRRRIGYLPEHTPLYGDMLVREFLFYRARLKGVPRRRMRNRVDYAIEKTDLKARVNHPIDTLSKGLRQRVGIADALVGDPKLLILDEPTIGLDPNQIREVRALIRELGESHTLLLSTHILSEVEMVANRVVIIAAGRCVADSTVEGLLEEHHEDVIDVEVRADETTDAIRQKLTQIAGVSRVEPLWERIEGTHQRFEVHCASPDHSASAEALARSVHEAGWGLLRLSPRRPTLEQIFVKLTMRDHSHEPGEEAA